MNIDKMRMDFEVWECGADEGPQTDPAWLMFDEKTNTFPLDKIQERWRVWQASRAAIEVESFSKEELNLFRQWFNAMEDLVPTYIEKSDCDLYSKVMEMLK